MEGGGGAGSLRKSCSRHLLIMVIVVNIWTPERQLIVHGNHANWFASFKIMIRCKPIIILMFFPRC